MQKVVGVFGSSGAEMGKNAAAKARSLGKAIAGKGCILLTGACTGLPHEAARAAKENGGMVIGVSPAGDLQGHREQGYPDDCFDFIVFTGFGIKGRNVVLVRSCDAAVFMSGRTGTLNEFTIAYDEGKRIGVLAGSGGTTGMIDTIVKSAGKDTGASVVSREDPAELVEILLRRK
jgi:uncharacterized protein (TIGR00725 family)